MEELNPENLNDFINKVCQEAKEALHDDPEWTKKNWYHIKTLIEAIAYGILAADPYHKNYYVPKNFEKVINYYIYKLHEKLKLKDTDETVEICLIKFEGITRQILFNCPEFLEWNTIGDTNDIFVTKYDTISPNKQFMDLDAMIRNSGIFLRDYTRKCDEFDRKFEEKYGKLNDTKND